MHKNIQLTRRALGHPPRSNLDRIPRPDRTTGGGTATVPQVALARAVSTNDCARCLVSLSLS
eukprot:2972185-Pyramimonas_sp.AAC.1